jgi:hypothetical protein
LISGVREIFYLVCSFPLLIDNVLTTLSFESEIAAYEQGTTKHDGARKNTGHGDRKQSVVERRSSVIEDATYTRFYAVKDKSMNRQNNRGDYQHPYDTVRNMHARKIPQTYTV